MATHRDREVYPPVITDGLPSTVLEYDDPFWDLLSRGTLVGSANLPVTTTRTGSRKSVDSATDEELSTNLQTYSEQFDNPAWTKAQSGVTPNQVANPVDSTVNADFLYENTANAEHGVYDSMTLSNHTLSVFARANTRSAFQLRIRQAAGQVVSAGFDLSTGNVIAISNQGTYFTTATSSIEDVGGGWYRCSVHVVCASFSVNVFISLLNTATPSYDTNGEAAYTGDGSGLYLWGAQLVAMSTAGKYQQTVAAAATPADLFYHSGLPVIGVMNGATNLVDTDLTNWTQTSLAITEPSTGVYRVTVPASSTSYANVAIAGGFINRIGSFQARLISGTPAGTCYMTFANGGSSTGVNASFIGLGADWTPLEFSRTSATNTDGVFLYALSQPTEVVIEIRYIRAVDSTVAHPAFPDGSAAAAAYGIDTVLCLPTWAANGTLVQAIVPYGYTGNGPSGAGARIYEQNNGLAYRPSSIIVAGSGGAPSLNDGTGVSEGSVTVLSMDWDGVDIGARFDDGTRLTATEADTPAGALAIGVTQGGLTPFHGALLSVKYDYVLPDAQYEILRVGFTNLLSTFTFR